MHNCRRFTFPRPSRRCRAPALRSSARLVEPGRGGWPLVQVEAVTRHGRLGPTDPSQRAADRRVTAAIKPRNGRRGWASDVRRARRSGSPRRPLVRGPHEVIHLGGRRHRPPCQLLTPARAGAPRPRRRLKTPSTPPPRPGSPALDEKAVHRANAFLADDSDCLRTPTPTTPSVRAPPDCTGYPPEVPRALQRDRRPHLRRPRRPDGRRPLTSRALLPRLAWNQTWCELWFTRVVSSS